MLHAEGAGRTVGGSWKARREKTDLVMASKDFYVEPKGAAVNENPLWQAVFRNIDCAMRINQGILNNSMRRWAAALRPDIG